MESLAQIGEVCKNQSYWRNRATMDLNRGTFCNALFNYLIILLDVMIYVYILYDFDDYVTYL